MLTLLSQFVQLDRILRRKVAFLRNIYLTPDDNLSAARKSIEITMK